VWSRNCGRCGKDFITFYQRSHICEVCKRPKGLRGQEPELAGRSLTVRETQITVLVCDGKTNKEIGDVLHIREGTVKSFMGPILAKAQVTNRTALAAWWLRKK
jgi:DNA-binding NarL/FixJ family response regulator